MFLFVSFSDKKMRRFDELTGSLVGSGVVSKTLEILKSAVDPEAPVFALIPTHHVTAAVLLTSAYLVCKKYPLFEEESTVGSSE